MNTVIHPESKRMLDAIVRDTPHALLVTGPVGIGLTVAAQEAAELFGGHVLKVLPEKNEKVDIAKGTITVDSIRRLYDMTRTIEPSGRTIIIDYAERMAPAAQNAFLKLLEEPSEGTHFILLTHQPELLLPTITSRVQKVDLRPVSPLQSGALLDTLKVVDTTKRAQLLFIAEGLPAELVRLVSDNEAFESRASIVKDARTYITGSAYDRLLLAKKYKDSRETALMLIEDALKLLRRTIAQNGDTSSLRLASRLEVLHKRVTEQGNVRLQLSAAVMV